MPLGKGILRTMAKSSLDPVFAGRAARFSGGVTAAVISFLLPGISLGRDEEILAKGKTTYQNLCVSCHDEKGEVSRMDTTSRFMGTAV